MPFPKKLALAMTACLLVGLLLPASASAGTLCGSDRDRAGALRILPGVRLEHGWGGEHYSYFEAVAGHSYIIQGDIVGTGGWSQLNMWLEDGNGTGIVFDFGSPAYGCQVRYRPTESGRYYVRTWLAGGYGAPVTYALTVSDIPHSSISGTARDMTTGLPLSGIDVTLVQDLILRNTIEVVTETTRTAFDGSYRFDVAWPARCTVQFSDPSGLREGEYYGGLLVDLGAQRITTPWTGADIISVDGNLGLPWSLRARLVDAVTGRPIAGVRLGARVISPRSFVFSQNDGAVSDSDGLVSMSFDARSEAFPVITDSSGAYPAQYIESPGSPSFAGSIRATPGTTATVDIPVRRGGGIMLRLRDRRSGLAQPALHIRLEFKEAFHITAYPATWGDPRWVSWKTAAQSQADSSGTVRFSGLAPGVYRAYVEGSGDATYDQWVGAPGSGTGDGAIEYLVSPACTSTADAYLALPDDRVAPEVRILSKPPTTLVAGAQFQISGDVIWNGTGASDETLALEVSVDGVRWSDSGLRAKTGVDGRFQFAIRPSSRTYYRVALSEGWWNLAGLSGVLCVRPRATLGSPVAPSAAKRSHSFTVYGTLSPRHSAGSRPVRIYLWRSVHGSWHAEGYVLAAASDHAAVTRYRASVTLRKAGRWRVRAYHSDTGHVAGWSSHYDYVNIK